MATSTRGKGEDSVYQRADGRWVAAVEVGWTSKGRQRRTVTAPTKREVLAKLRKLREEVGVGVVGDDPTLDTWLEHWLTKICPARGLKPSTLTGYRSYIDQHLKPRVGSRRLRSLTPEHVRRLHRDMADAGLSSATVRQAHAILSRALKVAVREGHVIRNVASLVDVPGVVRNPHDSLSAEDARKVLRAAESPRELARLTCALVLGLRQGEALGLTWPAIDLDARTLEVSQALYKPPGADPVLVAPKSKASRRLIPLPAAVVDIFRAYAARPEDEHMVFPGAHGGMERDPRRDWEAWRHALARVDVAPVPLHGARASAASLLRAMGESERVIADILGHATVQVTMEHYIRSDATQRLAALDTAALELLGEPVPLARWQVHVTVGGETSESAVEAATIPEAVALACADLEVTALSIKPLAGELLPAATA